MIKKKKQRIVPYQKIKKGLHIYVEGIESFWTKKEYTLQDLIICGIVVHREGIGKQKDKVSYARIDIIYDSPNGLGRKMMSGFEQEVFEEAKK